MRRSSFSIRSRAIRPLDFDGTRRRNVLRGVGYAWTPKRWSFEKLQEVGFLPTWVLFSFLVLYECLSRNRPLRAVRSVPKHGTELLEIFF